MTVKRFIKEQGWIVECEAKTCRAMSVCIVFDNNGREDETEFDITPYDVNELSKLYSDFCKEEGISRHTVTYIYISNMADSMEEL